MSSYYIEVDYSDDDDTPVIRTPQENLAELYKGALIELQSIHSKISSLYNMLQTGVKGSAIYRKTANKLIETYQDQFWEAMPKQDYTLFIRRVINTVDTLPFKYYQKVKDRFDRETRASTYERQQMALDFISQNVDMINQCREMYVNVRCAFEGHKPEDLREAVRQELTNMIQTYKDKPLKREMFKQHLSKKLLNLPLFMTWDEMYEYYNRHVKTTKPIELPSTYFHQEPVQRPYNPKAKPRTLHEPLHNKYSSINLEPLKQDHKTKTPWRTPTKKNAYIDNNKLNPNEIDTSRTIPDSFNMKEQRKLMRHHVAPPNTFVCDYMYAGRFAYMLAINVNTRKAFFAIPKEIYLDGHHWRSRGKANDWHVNAESAVESLKDLMRMTKVEGLIMDQESGWTSHEFKQFLERHGIKYRFVHKNDLSGIIETQKPSRSNHSTTSLVDRLIRTLRQMNYNLGHNNEIDPNRMMWLIEEYNNSPHTTLSKIIGRQVTPNEVDEDESLERKIVSELMRENFIKSLQPEATVKGARLRVLNEANYFDKVKPKLLPGYWRAVRTEKGLVELTQDDHTIKVPRWMIKSEKF